MSKSVTNRNANGILGTSHSRSWSFNLKSRCEVYCQACRHTTNAMYICTNKVECWARISAFRDFPLPSLLPFLRGPHPINQLGCLGERCKLPTGVWGEAPAYKRFGAYLSQKEQLWWKQFLCIFIGINLNFCTNIRLL